MTFGQVGIVLESWHLMKTKHSIPQQRKSQRLGTQMLSISILSRTLSTTHFKPQDVIFQACPENKVFGKGPTSNQQTHLEEGVDGLFQGHGPPTQDVV